MLLERRLELAAIRSGTEEAVRGSGRVLVVEGEPGVGKTALLDAAATTAREGGMRTLLARGRELEREFGFGVVRQLFEPIARDGESAGVLSGPARFAAPVLGVELGRQAPAPPTAETVYPAIHGLYWLTLNLAEEAPLALLVDDAQWADGASSRFLAYLGSRVAELPIVVVVAVRRGERADRLRHALAGCVRLEPQPLSEAATARLVRSLAPAADDQTCRSLYMAAGGNAFFVRELAMAITEGGMPSGAWSPESVTRTIAGRIAALDSAAREVARACAVLGEEPSLRAVATIAGMADDAAGEALDLLRAAGILAPTQAVEFAHPIIRSAVEDTIPAARLAAAHATAARLEAAGGQSGERVASHLLECEPAEDPWVSERLVAAARAASARGAPEAAAAYLERALAEPPPAAARPRLLLELGTAMAYALRPGATGVVRRGFELAASSEARLDAALLHAHMSLQAGRGADALEPLFQVIDESPADSARAMRIEGFAANLTRAQLSGRRAAAPMIARLRQRSAGPDADPPVAIATAAELAMEGVELERAVELAHAGLARLDAVPPLARAFAGLTAVRVLIVADDDAGAATVLEQAIDKARSRGALFDFIYYAVSRANLAYRAGRVADSEANARDVYEIARGERWPLGLASIASYLVHTLIERGERGEAWEVLRESGLDGPGRELSDVYTANALLLARSRLRLEDGDPEAALTDLDELERRQLAFGELNPAVSPWRSAKALALHALGKPAAAREFAAEELALSERWQAPRAIGIALRAAGLVADESERRELLERSATVLESSFARLEHGRALADLGTEELRRGEPERARERLRAALEIAHRGAAATLEERALAGLRATGARPRRALLRGPGALTPSEARVAAMAARGLSNHEIAEQLFVTVRTIEYHLQSAYRKLGIDAREKLEVALASE